MHGSHYFKVLDDSAFFAVASLELEFFPLTASFNMYFERPVAAGELIGSGRVIQQSKRLYIAESQLVDDRGRELARGSGTFMSSRTPWSEIT